MKEGSQSRPKHPMRENAVYEYDAKHKDQLMQDGKHNERQPDTKQGAQLNPQRRNKGKRGVYFLTYLRRPPVRFPARDLVPESATPCSWGSPEEQSALSLLPGRERGHGRDTGGTRKGRGRDVRKNESGGDHGIDLHLIRFPASLCGAGFKLSAAVQIVHALSS